MKRNGIKKISSRRPSVKKPFLFTHEKKDSWDFKILDWKLKKEKERIKIPP